MVQPLRAMWVHRLRTVAADTTRSAPAWRTRSWLRRPPAISHRAEPEKPWNPRMLMPEPPLAPPWCVASQGTRESSASRARNIPRSGRAVGLTTRAMYAAAAALRARRGAPREPDAQQVAVWRTEGGVLFKWAARASKKRHHLCQNLGLPNDNRCFCAGTVEYPNKREQIGILLSPT